MKLIELAQRIDKSRANEAHFDVDKIADDLGIEIPWVEVERIKAYWAGSWRCTDTEVGYCLYFFDGEPMAFSSQTARKSEEEFKWFSEAIAQRVRDYLLSLVPEEDNSLNIDVVALDDEIGDGFSIEFNKQVMRTDDVYLDNQKVKITKFYKEELYIDQKVDVEFLTGGKRTVNIGDLLFGFFVD